MSGQLHGWTGGGRDDDEIDSFADPASHPGLHSVAPTGTMIPPSFRSGTIAYRRQSGEVWGHEAWSVRCAGDGCRTLTVHCDMRFGGDHVTRDTILSVAPDWHPVDAFVRIQNHGKLTGSGWFRFTDDEATCESWSIDAGRVSQRFPVVRPMRGFGIHALMGDGWMAATFPYDRGPGHQEFAGRNLLHSLHHFGATGPTIATSSSGLRYEGRDAVTVPAGSFDCHRLSFVGMTNAHPPYVMWISADGDFRYIRGEVGGYMDSVFELTSLSAGGDER